MAVEEQMACTSALWLNKEEKEKRFCDVLARTHKSLVCEILNRDFSIKNV